MIVTTSNTQNQIANLGLKYTMQTHSVQMMNNEPTVRNRIVNGLKKSFMAL